MDIILRTIVERAGEVTPWAWVACVLFSLNVAQYLVWRDIYLEIRTNRARWRALMKEIQDLFKTGDRLDSICQELTMELVRIDRPPGVSYGDDATVPIARLLEAEPHLRKIQRLRVEIGAIDSRLEAIEQALDAEVFRKEGGEG